MDTKAVKDKFGNITCTIIDDYTNWTDQKIFARNVLYSGQAFFEIKVIVPIIFIIGVLGNAAFFLMLARVKSMRTITNFYLANLAAADLMILIIQTMYHLWNYIYSFVAGAVPYKTNFGCIASFFVYNVFYCASTLLIAVVSCDRYIAICLPLKYRNMKLNKRKLEKASTALLWIVSIIFSSLAVLKLSIAHRCITWPTDKRYENFPSVIQACVAPNLFMDILSTFIYILPFFITLIITTINNIRIIKKLRQPPVGNNEDQAKGKINRRICWMLMANSTIFFCCLAPNIYHHIWVIIRNSEDYNLFHSTFILAMVNSAINPFLYGVASPSYRRGFLKAFGFARVQIGPSED